MEFKKIIEKGLSLGIEEIEIYAESSESNTLSLLKGKVETYNLSKLNSVTVRGLYNGKMAAASTEVATDEAIESLLLQLIENSKVLTSPEKEFIYGGEGEYKEVEPLKADYNEHSFEEKVALLKEMEERALAADPRIVQVGHCNYSETSSKVEIINSKGVELKEEASYMSFVIGVLAADEKGNTSMGYAGDINTKFAEFEKDRVLAEALEGALSTLGAESPSTGEYEIVLHRDVATQLLQAFSSIFSGYSAMKKMSILVDKIGSKIFGENITIVDDPFYQDALVKSSFDGEGVPTKTKKIVENGVFNGFMHNQKTGHFFGTESTGNGTKGGKMVRPTNLVLLPGSESKEEIIKQVSRGIYITDVAGLHAGLNPISGAFNVQSKGALIENGEIVKPITLFVASGNFFEMMNEVTHIGNDIEKRFTGVAAPTLAIKKLMISGK